MTSFNDDIGKMFKIDCPVCNSKDVSSITKIVEVPFYGKLLLLTFLCNKCGYKTSEIFNLEERQPRRYILRCETEQDLKAKVIKSGSCTIRIPELEIDIEPGPSSEGYITNVEGILRRIEPVLLILKHNYSNLEELNKIKEKIKILNKLIEGLSPFTIIIEDPLGTSSIVYEKNLVVEDLTDQEIDELRKGNIFFIDIENDEGQDKKDD
ncbi:MAG: ZPR1 zinc finger domain-containing protein [Candidatus Helarchaeota archaeon]